MRAETRTLPFYAPASCSLSDLVAYRQAVRRRRAAHAAAEGKKDLPASVLLFSGSYQEDDTNGHIAARVAAAAEPSRIREFVRGEVQMFCRRLDAASDDLLFATLIGECLDRFQEDIRHQVIDGKVRIEIDSPNSPERKNGKSGINWLGIQKRSAQTVSSPSSFSAQKLASGSYLPRALSDIHTALVRCNYSVEIVAHFTHFSGLHAPVSSGYVASSGRDGVRSILIRAFSDIQQKLVADLYISGKALRKYVVPDSSVSTAPGLAQLREQHVPPCIRETLRILRANGHLKYHDRKYLSNFLKNSGVPVEEAIRIFRDGFNCPGDRFDREYKYSIEHAYGLRGSMKDYKTAFCGEIIRASQIPGCTGCPFADRSAPREVCAEALRGNSGKKEADITSPVDFYVRSLGISNGQ